MQLLLAPLRFFDRHSRVLLALGVFVGVLSPDLARWLNPFIVPAVLGCLVGALLLLDWERVASEAKRARLVVSLVVVQLVVSPLAAWYIATGLQLSPTLREIVFLQSAAPPIASAAVFLMLVGLDGGLALVVSVLSLLLLPLTLTVLMALFLSTSLEIGLVGFFVRACAMIGIPFVIAWVVRKCFSARRLRSVAGPINGLNVLLLVVFAIGVMDGVYAEFVSSPASAMQLFVTAWIMAFVLHGCGYLTFIRCGQHEAMSAAVASGNRNLGIMFAVTAAMTSRDFALYVGIAQIPMYFVPLLMAPIVRRWMRASS